MATNLIASLAPPTGFVPFVCGALLTHVWCKHSEPWTCWQKNWHTWLLSSL